LFDGGLEELQGSSRQCQRARAASPSVFPPHSPPKSPSRSPPQSPPDSPGDSSDNGKERDLLALAFS
jgi:hypothetical protein